MSKKELSRQLESTINPMMDPELENGHIRSGETPAQKRLNKFGAVGMIGIMFVIFFAALGFDVPENPFLVEEDGNNDSNETAGDRSLAEQRTVFVHLFEWKWTDIEKECVNFLGPKGFSAVQVSPVQEHVDHTKVSQIDTNVQPDFMPWWARYQPVSYKLESRSGTREELISMIETCQSVGVDIYVDILFNHMAATNTEFGNAGTPFNSNTLEYEMYDASHFNTCDPPEIQNEDWGSNADRVRRCRLVGLPDLNHDIPYVKETLIAHAQDLMDIGVKGLRLDAGKHMYVHDVNELLGGLTGEAPYVFSEIIDYGFEAISVLEYTPYYDVTEFRYESTVKNRFKDSNLADLGNIGENLGFVPADKAVVFLDNHDSQRHVGHLTYKDGDVYTLANIFMLAHPYGYPKLMSSFFFEDGQKDRGPPSDADGNTHSVYNDDGTDNCGKADEWVCEHRNNKVANMVGFRNYVSTVGAYEVAFYWTNGFQATAFARYGSQSGTAGFVIINKEGFDLSQSWNTGMPAGQYCDVISGDKGEGQDCTGRIVTVDENGYVTTTVSAMDALAIYGTPA